MDIKEYIASGILEQYVLGDLTLAERREVQEHAFQYPEIKKEIAAIEEAMFQYGMAHAVQPSAGLEEKILSKLEDSPKVEDQTTKRKGGNNGLSNALIGLSLIAAVGAGIWGFNQKQKLDNAQQQLTELQNNYDQLEADCNEQLQQKQQTEAYFAFLKDINTKPVQMAGTPKSPDAVASVFWNNDQKKTYLETTRLPAVPTGRQYQLWAIVDGTPVDMGVFDVVIGINNFIEVPHIENPQAFAVTLEDAGGQPAPTLEEMIVVGNVS